jgi:uncharacterized protein
MRDTSEQLRRIQHAITKIAGYVKKGHTRFDKEEEVRLSIIRHLQTISEAAQSITQDFKDHHPEIPWQQMVSFRDFLTFYYIEVDRDNLWDIATQDISDLKSKIDSALDELISSKEGSEKRDTIAGKSKATGAFGELLQAKREDILRTAVRHGAYNVRVFGSVARGEADAESDIDLLIDVEPGRTLFDISELLMDLQELLGHNVDIVTEKGLHNRVRERVLKEALPL